MAGMLPTDVIIPSPVGQYIAHQIVSKSAIAQTMVANMNLDAQAKLGGDYFTAPVWQEDGTAAEVVDGNPSTPGKLTALADIAPVCRRKRVRAVVGTTSDALGNLNADAPQAEWMDSAADFWAREIDRIAIKSLTGMFDSSAGALKDTHILRKGNASGTVVPASGSLIIDAKTLLGDNSQDLVIGIAHSKVMADLEKEAGQRGGWGMLGPYRVFTYAGINFLQHDGVPTSGSSTFKKFTTIMLRVGAIYVAWQNQFSEWVTVDATVPQVVNTQLSSVAVAFRGMRYVGAANPADTVLDDAASWSKSSGSPTTATDKTIGIVALETNAT